MVILSNRVSHEGRTMYTTPLNQDNRRPPFSAYAIPAVEFALATIDRRDEDVYLGRHQITRLIVGASIAAILSGRTSSGVLRKRRKNGGWDI